MLSNSLKNRLVLAALLACLLAGCAVPAPELPPEHGMKQQAAPKHTQE